MDNRSYSKGISWIDDCRIPFVDDVSLTKKLPIQKGGTIYGGGKGFHRTTQLNEYKEGGRFPANILVSDDMLNDGVVTKQNPRKYNNKGDNKIFVGAGKGENFSNGDKGSNSRYYDIDKWFDKILDV